MADITTALVSGGAGLLGAVIGALSTQLAAHKTRESDRRKRCVERVLTALTQLDQAYSAYVTATASGAEAAHVVLPLQGAVRGYNQAVEMVQNPWLRIAAAGYRDRLTEFYLMFGEPRDPLDNVRVVPTLQELNDEHARLSEKLRHYELT